MTRSLAGTPWSTKWDRPSRPSSGLLSDLDCVHDERARRLAGELRPLMAEAREAADRLEKLVDDELWPLPKYREMLFVK